jgi:hypothetical protein
MPLTVAESVAETADNFVTRTLTFTTAATGGVRVSVEVVLYTNTGVAATAGMISDSGGHTWSAVPGAGITGDGSTGGVAILSTVATGTISNITLTPGGSGNYATWAISRLSAAADIDDGESGSGSSSAPQAASMTSTSTDGVALSVISTRNQSGNQTPPSGWTAIHLEPNNSAHLAGGIARSPNITSTGAVPSVWASADGGQWYAASALFKAAATLNHYTLTADGGSYAVTGTAATLVAPRVVSAASGSYSLSGTAATLSVTPLVYMVMGGTETEGWFGHEGKGGADSTATITFPEEVPAGAAIVVVLTCYQFNPTLSEISDDGGNTWTILQRAATIGGGSVDASVSQIRSVLTSPCNVFTYDATALPAGDAGRYGQIGAYVFSSPDTVNGFFTATAASNTQGSTSSVAPGTVTPDTDRSFVIFAGNNRGHTTDLKPYTKPSGYTDDSLIHSEIDGDGAESAVHNSTTQSGWWFGKSLTTYTPQTPTFGFSVATGGALSLLAIYNIQGGEAGAVISAEPGSYALSGTNASLEYGREIAANAGTVTMTGTAASLRLGARVAALGGSYALTGTNTVVRVGRLLTAAGGSYAQSGTAASLELGRALDVDAGVYALTGTAASLVYSGASSTYTLTSDAGTYALSGTASVLRYGRIVVSESAVYALSGTNSVLFADRHVVSSGGTYLLTGSAETILSVDIVMAALAGSYAFTGTDATLQRTRELSSGAGVYSVTGSDVTFSTTSDTFFIPRSVITDAVYRAVTRLTARLRI